jgi:hypothetical protein
VKREGDLTEATDRFDVGGTVYQCEFAVESADLYVRNRGFLAITTNAVIVWVDRKQDVTPLGRAPTFTLPPGI